METEKACTGPCGQTKPLAEFRQRADSLRPHSQCRACEAAAEKARYKTRKERYMPPPLEAIPEGFEVMKLSTEVGEDGEPKKQFIGARPERVTPAPHLQVPEGYALKRLSTLTDGNEKIVQQWQIFTPEAEAKAKREQWLLDAIGSLAEKWPVREPIQLAEGPAVDERLMCVVPMGDPHFGQYSWAAETGDDYDLQLAEQYHCTAMKALVDSAPRAKRGKLINLGDFVHADNSDNRTLRGHHQLDVDTRWPKVIRSSVQSVIWLVNYMLTKFQEVDAWMVPGNHDPHSAFMLQLGLQLYFRNEPRVRIPEVAGLFYYERFGKSLIGSTHTHTIKDRASLGETMAVHQPKDWGESLFRYWYCGHVHHDSMIETKGGVIVETLRTLAGKDKFAAENAYNAGRDMKCDVFDLEDGRIQRNVIGIRQIQRRIKEQTAE